MFEFKIMFKLRKSTNSSSREERLERQRAQERQQAKRRLELLQAEVSLLRRTTR